MNILRVRRQEGFTQIPNDVLRDERLSWKARGMLCFLLSHSDGFRFNREHLAQAAPDGETAVRSALKELTDAGYYWVDRSKDEQGRFHSIVTVTDHPDLTTDAPPLDGFPPPGDDPAVNPPVLEHQEEHDIPNPAPATASAPSKPEKKTRTHPGAQKVAVAFWEASDPKPMLNGGFLALRGIVSKALQAGYSEGEVLAALGRVTEGITSWTLERQLKRGRAQPAGRGWDPDRLSREGSGGG